jgi:hypothetical protein
MRLSLEPTRVAFLGSKLRAFPPELFLVGTVGHAEKPKLVPLS